MAINISAAQLWVHDQDEALDFYTKKVGMEVRADVTVARARLTSAGSTVAPSDQPDVAIVADGHPGCARDGRARPPTTFAT